MARAAQKTRFACVANVHSLFLFVNKFIIKRKEVMARENNSTGVNRQSSQKASQATLPLQLICRLVDVIDIIKQAHARSAYHYVKNSIRRVRLKISKARWRRETVPCSYGSNAAGVGPAELAVCGSESSEVVGVFVFNDAELGWYPLHLDGDIMAYWTA